MKSVLVTLAFIGFFIILPSSMMNSLQNEIDKQTTKADKAIKSKINTLKKLDALQQSYDTHLIDNQYDKPKITCDFTRKMEQVIRIHERNMLYDMSLLKRSDLRSLGFDRGKIAQNFMATLKHFCIAKYALWYHLGMVYRNPTCEEVTPGGSYRAKEYYQYMREQVRTRIHYLPCGARP